LRTSGTSCPETERNQGAQSCAEQGGPTAGNPINFSIGNKYQREVDYVAAGDSGLNFTRHYNSVGSNADYLGKRWTHTYSRRVLRIDGSSVKIIRQDGEVRYFSTCGAVWCGSADEKGELTETVDGSATTAWTYRDENDVTEVFDAGGRLMSETSRAGIKNSLTYVTSGRLGSITNSFGHQLLLTYDSSGRIWQLQLPGGSTITYGYDGAGNLSTVTYPDSQVRTYLYNEPAHVAAGAHPNLLTGILDEAGARFATFKYDTQSRASESFHGVDADRIQITYNANGTATILDSAGTSRTYTFQALNDVKKVSQTNGPVCTSCRLPASLNYNTAGDVLESVDYNGVRTTFVPNARHLESSRTEAFGTPRARTISTLWQATYRLPTQIDEPGLRATFTHDAAGNVLTKTVLDTAISESRTWTYTYNAFGRVLTSDGPRTDVTDVTTSTHYACTTGTQCGQLNTATNAMGHVTIYNTYNAHGQPLTITDPNGVVTTLTYDARQRLKTRTVGGELTQFDYWPTGLLKKATLPDGSYLEYGYDNAHRLTSITDSEANYVNYTLDAMGNRTSDQVFDPSSVLTRTRTRVFNTLNQLAEEIAAAGGPAVTKTFAYDDNGNKTNINAPLGRNTVQAYDELNRLTQVTNPVSGVTKYGYNSLDQLISVTDPRNKVTSYTYNALGDLKKLTSPDTGVTDNTYDSGGNLKTSKDARNKTGTYNYDALNRVTSLAYTDQTITYTYDAGTNQIGRLTQLASSGATTSWTHDTLGRVLSKTQVSNGNTKTIAYQYNSAGQLTQITTPSNKVILYGYANGKVSSITINGTTLLNNIVYEPFGPVGGWSWGNGTMAVRTYDLDGRVGQVDSAGLRTYTWDNADRITQIVDAQNSSLNQGYGYDNLDRLMSVTKSSGNQSFTYDANSNRKSYTDGAASSTYVIAGASNRVTSITGSQARTYTYNAVGAVTGDGSKTFAYSDRERMKSTTVGGSTWNYYHNGFGERVRKKLAPSGNHYYVYDEADHLIGEYNNNALIQETVWLGDIPVATLRGTSIYYVQTDHLNAPKKVTQPSNNAVRWSWDRAPFGTTAPNENPSGLGTFLYNLRLPGQFYDTETGLSYNYYRDYDPSIGRYVQSDPIGLRGGLNTYAYVGGNPIMAFDSLGLETCLLTTLGPGGIRDHSAIYTSQGDGSGGPALYDPAGSYSDANEGGSGNLLTGDAASIEKFMDFHEDQEVESTCKDTSQKEEESIINNATNLPSASAFACAVRASTALSGLPSFPHVKAGTFWPGNLRRQFMQVP
jgi:RHS repeat-associated protein